MPASNIIPPTLIPISSRILVTQKQGRSSSSTSSLPQAFEIECPKGRQQLNAPAMTQDAIRKLFSTLFTAALKCAEEKKVSLLTVTDKTDEEPCSVEATIPSLWGEEASQSNHLD
ncbi:hypothetical protein Tco_0047774 [Tanacetum coccineum]